MERKSYVFDRVVHLFFDTSISSLKKYKIRDYIFIYSFNYDDLENVIEKNIIPNVPTIYFLRNNINNTIYIGETENFTNRIKDHKKNKKFDEIFVVNMNSMSKSIRLEIEIKTINSFTNSIEEYKIINSNKKTKAYLSEVEKVKLKNIWEIFYKDIYFLLGFNLSPRKDKQKKVIEKVFDETIFFYKNAKMQIVDRGFLLLEGSQIHMGDWKNKKLKHLGSALKIREKLIIENKVTNEGILTENLFCKTPSPLSNLISGHATTGYERFKTKKGITLKKYSIILNKNKKNINVA